MLPKIWTLAPPTPQALSYRDNNVRGRGASFPPSAVWITSFCHRAPPLFYCLGKGTFHPLQTVFQDGKVRGVLMTCFFYLVFLLDILYCITSTYNYWLDLCSGLVLQWILGWDSASKPCNKFQLKLKAEYPLFKNLSLSPCVSIWLSLINGFVYFLNWSFNLTKNSWGTWSLFATLWCFSKSIASQLHFDIY